MPNTSHLDDIPKGAWIAITVVGFIVFWPIGLAILGFLLWSGKMNSWKCSKRSGYRRSRFKHYQSSGNSAFDAYRDETLQRLEEEQKAFAEFMEKLRRAKDQSEFDQFMADRNADQSTPQPSPGNAA